MTVYQVTLVTKLKVFLVYTRYHILHFITYHSLCSIQICVAFMSCSYPSKSLSPPRPAPNILKSNFKNLLPFFFTQYFFILCLPDVTLAALLYQQWK